MRLVVSSLSSADRLSIVAFSGSSKRVLPLRRMTSNGRLSARRIIDALVACQGTSSVSDVLRKAMKVLEDRRERNAVASIVLLSDGDDGSGNQRRQSPFVSSTRFPNLEIPVHSVNFSQFGTLSQSSSSSDPLSKCIRSLVNVVVLDLRLELRFAAGSSPAEIAAVYSYSGRPSSLGSGSIRLGDFYAGEERESLVELKIPSSTIGAHRVLTVRCFCKNQSSQKEVYAKEQTLPIPRPQAVRSSTPGIARLRNVFVITRAVAESRRLMERNDLNGAYHMLSSARALLIQSRLTSANEFIRSLEAELAEIQQKREKQSNSREGVKRLAGEKSEALTPTSAWKAAERLAKVAIMRKSMNRVGDLHGFEDARF